MGIGARIALFIFALILLAGGSYEFSKATTGAVALFVGGRLLVILAAAFLALVAALGGVPW